MQCAYQEQNRILHHDLALGLCNGTPYHKKQPHSQSGLIQNMKALCDSLMVLQMNRFFKDGVTSCKIKQSSATIFGFG